MTRSLKIRSLMISSKASIGSASDFGGSFESLLLAALFTVLARCEGDEAVAVTLGAPLFALEDGGAGGTAATATSATGATAPPRLLKSVSSRLSPDTSSSEAIRRLWNSGPLKFLDG
jgi:hypothetical protein